MGHYRVGDVARIVNASVRSLHHHDEIGPLVPSERSEAGYRLYSGAGLARRSRIRFYRKLDPRFAQTYEAVAVYAVVAGSAHRLSSSYRSEPGVVRS